MAMYFSNAMKKDRHALTPFKGRYQELVLLMLSSAAIGGLLTGSMFSTEPLPETMLIPAPGTHGKRLGYMPPASKGKMEMLQMEASAPKKEDMWVETVLLEPRVFLVRVPLAVLCRRSVVTHGLPCTHLGIPCTSKLRRIPLPVESKSPFQCYETRVESSSHHMLKCFVLGSWLLVVR